MDHQRASLSFNYSPFLKQDQPNHQQNLQDSTQKYLNFKDSHNPFNKQSQNFNDKMLDFTDIMQSLQQPSGMQETPFGKQYGQNYLENLEEEQYFEEKSTSMRIQDMQDKIKNQKKIKDRNEEDADKENQQSITKKNNKKKGKVDIGAMINQLDDLKLHINTLDQKIEFNSNHQKKSLKKSISSSIQQSSQKKISKNTSGNISQEKSQSRQLSQQRNSSKKLSWGDNRHLIKGDSIDDYGKRIRTQLNKSLMKDQTQQDTHNAKSILKQSVNRKILDQSLNPSQSSQKLFKSSSLANSNIFQSQNHFNMQNKVSISDLHSRQNSEAILSQASHTQINENQRYNCSQNESDSDYFPVQQLNFTNNNIDKSSLQNVSSKQLPPSQQNLLQHKIKECEQYKNKNSLLKKKVKTLKQELISKDQIISQFKSLQKEMRQQKEQWRISEDIRNGLAQQNKKVQEQLSQSQKENAKLKKKLQKMIEKDKIPIKVHIEDRTFNKDLTKKRIKD